MLLATLLLFQSPGTSTAAMTHRNGRVPPVATAIRVTAPPRIDGVLDDAAWASAAVSTGFRRDVPSDGKPATENSEIRVVYDDHALYVGARLYDRTGKVSRRLSRRDSFSVLNDVFFVAIDAFHDHSTEFIFGITPAGEQRDAIRSNDGSAFDPSWDPVWEVKTRIDSLGWVAELRIPFSQLRFSRASEQTWGIQFRRDNRAAAEASDWSWSPRTEPGVTSKYGHLVGLSAIPQPRRLEVLPYTAASSRYTEGADPANPFDNGSVYDGSIGGDVRYGLTSNITLNATVNPDFGQVEADPAVVNLTAYETFFEEHRPFFVERSDLFRFAEANGYPFFYSRRVGRTPSLSAAGAAPYVDEPQSTTILGAAKATGRASGGWSMGVLEAVTAKEYAHLASSDGQRLPDMGVEPLSNYAVARLRKDYKGGSSYVGGLITTVNRNLDEPQFDALRSSAYVAGLDWRHRFGRNNWSTTGWISGSRVNGGRDAMIATQTASARYYQRPDQDYVRVDSAASSLSGYSAAAVVSKDGGEWTTFLGGGITSPGFEINDAGFMLDADRIAMTSGVGRRWVTPGRTFRSFSIDAAVRQELNFGGVNIHRGATLGVNGTLNNLWNFNVFGTYNAEASNDRVTRGGPLRIQPSVAQVYASVGTDNRKTVSVSVYGNYADAEERGLVCRPGRQSHLPAPGRLRSHGLHELVQEPGGCVLRHPGRGCHGHSDLRQPLSLQRPRPAVPGQHDPAQLAALPENLDPALRPAAPRDRRLRTVQGARPSELVRLPPLRHQRVHDHVRRGEPALHHHCRAWRGSDFVHQPRLQGALPPQQPGVPLGIPSRFHPLRGVESEPGLADL